MLSYNDFKITTLFVNKQKLIIVFNLLAFLKIVLYVCSVVNAQNNLLMSHQILTKRPPEMPFKEYKRVRAIQNKNISNYLKKGRLVWLSQELVDISVPNGPRLPLVNKFKKGRTFVKRTEKIGGARELAIL